MVLTNNGFVFVSQKGIHVKMLKEGNPTLTVIVPAERKEIPAGTFNSIVRQSNEGLQNGNIVSVYLKALLTDLRCQLQFCMLNYLEFNEHLPTNNHLTAKKKRLSPGYKRGG
jgi:predicted RNA binding protein YcfA (HicA-like mRNA interferase family)